MTMESIDNSSKDLSAVAIKRICLLLALTLVPLLVGLGVWQLQRADQKQLMIDRAQTKVLTQLPAEIDPVRLLLPQAIELEARVNGERPLLLDNRTRDGRIGYEVLLPFQDLASGRWGIVNLGWMAAPADRSQLPHLTLPTALSKRSIHLSGLLVSAQPGYQLGVDIWQPGWPKRIQQPDLTRFESLLGQSLYPAIVRLKQPIDLPGLAELDSRWKLVNMQPHQHLGYAVQWFALASSLLVWLVWFGWWRSSKPTTPSIRSKRLQSSEL